MAKTGRPEDTAIRAKKLHQAREVARRLVETWEAEGKPEVVHALSFGNKAGVDGTERALIGDWFPLAMVPKARPHQWRLGELQKILVWDDPVEMLTCLAEEDPGTWWDILKKAEEDACSKAQERVIRTHFTWLMSAEASRNPGLPFPNLEGHKLCGENNSMRKMY